jgi:hypothetical protein
MKSICDKCKKECDKKNKLELDDETYEVIITECSEKI